MVVSNIMIPKIPEITAFFIFSGVFFLYALNRGKITIKAKKIKNGKYNSIGLKFFEWK